MVTGLLTVSMTMLARMSTAPPGLVYPMMVIVVTLSV
jgi:hypothetical protein